MSLEHADKGNLRIAIDSLGCKLNQAEAEYLSRQAAKAGCRLVAPDDGPDIYILNTCTVTHIADRKSRHLLRFAHQKNPRARIIVTGCYAERDPEKLRGIEGVEMVIGNDEKHSLFHILENAGYLNHVSQPALVSPQRNRAMVKIQEGCNNFCAYCIVPVVRRGEKSLPADGVVNEVKKRAVEGYKEVVLTGTRVGAYRDAETGLTALLNRILRETDICRVRLSSLQPAEIDADLLSLWSDDRLCPHFHLALQSGSDSVLERMNRRYTVAAFRSAVYLIRDKVPEVAITTDVIAGFPGEGEAEFEESYRFCRETGFARIHVFPFSPRAGTAAARMTPQVGEAEKKARTQKMLALAREAEGSFRKSFSGREMAVLWEKRTNGNLWSGLTGNYIRVYTRNDEDLTNRVTAVQVD